MAIWARRINAVISQANSVEKHRDFVDAVAPQPGYCGTKITMGKSSWAGDPSAGRTVLENKDSTATTVPLGAGMGCRFGRLRTTRSQITVRWHSAEITASASVLCGRQP